MANNKIQIKRSVANSTVSGLANGELAFTANGNILYIGDPAGGSAIPIGGKFNYGTLTANQAIVTNATAGVDKVIVANLVPTNIWANGAAGVAGQYLTSNSSGGVYWYTSPPGVTGSNTQIQFNDSGTLNASAGFVFDKATNNVTVANSIIAQSHSIVGNSTTLSTVTLSGSGLAAGNGTTTNTSMVITVANSAGNVQVTPISIRVGNSTVNTFSANNTRVAIGSGVALEANGTIGTANQVLRSSGASVYWADDTGDISSVTAANGLSGGGSTGDITLSVTGGSTLTVNTSGAHVNTNLSITSLTTSGDVTVNGNTKLGDASGDVISIVGSVNTHLMPSANVTYNVGNNTIRWNEIHASNVHSVSGYFDGSVSISGDLTVAGNVTTTNVNSIVVSDPMIYLAGNNYTSDSLDIGFAANYYDGATQRHTGFFRDATDGVYKLFANSTQELSGNNLVNTTAVGYTTATLIAYLSSGGLYTNSTAANLIANSTYSVGIVANTLTLSTPLAGSSGGTGLNTLTAEDILVANSSNGFRKLSVGVSGYVLQSNGSAVVYDVLDGGTF